MSEIFNPNYPAKFTQEDVENGRVNSDGTINFDGTSGGIVVRPTDGRFIWMESDTGDDLFFVMSDELFDRCFNAVTNGSTCRFISSFSEDDVEEIVITHVIEIGIQNIDGEEMKIMFLNNGIYSEDGHSALLVIAERFAQLMEV